MKKILVRSIRQIFTQSVHNAKQGEGWEASKVYQISVINFHYTKDDKNEMSWYTMKNEDGKKLAERLNIIFIDLVSIRKKIRTPVEELSPVEKWGLFLSYVDHDKQAHLVDSIVRSEEGLMAANSIIKHMSAEDSNWFTQNSIDTFQRDMNSIAKNAIKRGLEEGRKEGIQQGIQQGSQQTAIETAKRMLQDKLSIDKTSQYSGLPREKVLELQEQLTVKA